MQGYGPPQQPKKGTSPLVIVLAVIGGVMVLGVGSCVVCVGIGAAGAAKATAEAEKASKNRPTTLGESPTTTEQRPVAKNVSVNDLLSEYKANEIRADGRFKGEWVRVSGVVDSVKKDITDSMYVTVGTGQRFEIPQVQCFLTKSQEAHAASIDKGAKVTLTGKVSGLMMNVIVKDCEFE